MSSLNASSRQHLLETGYAHFPGVLSPSMLEDLTAVTDRLLAAQTPEEKQRFRYQGSNIGLHYQSPVLARLFSWPPALAALEKLGFPGPRWWSAFLLSKPPHAPPLYWHQDWWAWDDPCSALETPAQVFLMYYLADTSPENGCLRVIPGTHCRRIPLHDQLPDAHTEETYNAAPDSPLFCQHTEEVDVPVRAGDLVIGDARLLHAAHANQTNRTRSCLTLWYLPDYDGLPEAIKAAAARRRPLAPPDWWEGDEGKAVEPLVPYYTGDVPPASFNRRPGIHLQAR